VLGGVVIRTRRQVEIGDIIGDNEGFVVLERTFKNEKICVLTSTQVIMIYHFKKFATVAMRVVKCPGAGR
jgi:hypothetical protein